MNVYDFDGTIFPSNCSAGFCIWCMNRHPGLYFTFAPKAAGNIILFKLGKIPEYLMLRKFFSFLTKETAGLRKALDDPALRSQLGENAKKRSEKYTWQKRAEIYLNGSSHV